MKILSVVQFTAALALAANLEELSVGEANCFTCMDLAKNQGKKATFNSECYAQPPSLMGCVSVSLPGEESFYNGCQFCEDNPFESVSCSNDQCTAAQLITAIDIVDVPLTTTIPLASPVLRRVAYGSVLNSPLIRRAAYGTMLSRPVIRRAAWTRGTFIRRSGSAELEEDDDDDAKDDEDDKNDDLLDAPMLRRMAKPIFRRATIRRAVTRRMAKPILRRSVSYGPVIRRSVGPVIRRSVSYGPVIRRSVGPAVFRRAYGTVLSSPIVRRAAYGTLLSNPGIRRSAYGTLLRRSAYGTALGAPLSYGAVLGSASFKARRTGRGVAGVRELRLGQ